MDRTVRRLGSGIPEPFRDFLFGNNSCCFRDGTTLVFRYTFRPLLRFLLSEPEELAPKLFGLANGLRLARGTLRFFGAFLDEHVVPVPTRTDLRSEEHTS